MQISVHFFVEEAIREFSFCTDYLYIAWNLSDALSEFFQLDHEELTYFLFVALPRGVLFSRGPLPPPTGRFSKGTPETGPTPLFFQFN